LRGASAHDDSSGRLDPDGFLRGTTPLEPPTPTNSLHPSPCATDVLKTPPLPHRVGRPPSSAHNPPPRRLETVSAFPCAIEPGSCAWRASSGRVIPRGPQCSNSRLSVGGIGARPAVYGPVSAGCRMSASESRLFLHPAGFDVSLGSSGTFRLRRMSKRFIIPLGRSPPWEGSVGGRRGAPVYPDFRCRERNLPLVPSFIGIREGVEE